MSYAADRDQRYVETVADVIRSKHPDGMLLCKFNDLHNKALSRKFGTYKDFFDGKKPSLLLKGEAALAAGLVISGESGTQCISVSTTATLPVPPPSPPNGRAESLRSAPPTGHWFYRADDHVDHGQHAGSGTSPESELARGTHTGSDQAVTGDKTSEMNEMNHAEPETHHGLGFELDDDNENFDQISSLQNRFEVLKGDATQLRSRLKGSLPRDLEGLATGSTQSTLAAHDFSKWTAMSSLSAATVRQLKEDFIDLDRVEVHAHKNQVAEDLGLYELLQGEGILDAGKVAHEMQKRQAERNRGVNSHELPEAQKERIRKHLLERRSFNSRLLKYKIIEVARMRNMTTTGVAIVAFGMWAAGGEDPDDGDFNGVDDPDDRKLIVSTVSELKDYIEGHLRPNSLSRTMTDTAGRRGESKLENALQEAHVDPSTYKTEDQQLEDPEFEMGTCTPDVLFNDPIMIHGRKVKWIECKNKLLIPGLSTGSECNCYDKQIARYTEKYGPGAVFWGHGFSSGIQVRHELVGHFTIG
jgi:hypothetical protein